jgi:hypothetical protein
MIASYFIKVAIGTGVMVAAIFLTICVGMVYFYFKDKAFEKEFDDEQETQR